jgi:hypothetical protein
VNDFMKKTILLYIICLLTAFLSAAPVKSGEALRIASNWMQQISVSNSVSGIQTTANPEQNNVADWYVINFSQGGFIIISADDKAIPILGYDITGNFVTPDMPENLNWFINKYHEQFSMLRTLADAETHPAWQAVRNGDFGGFLPERPVAPLIQTNWDQSWPYNSLCPADAQGSGGHVYAGCGATTMAQIMKYWQYPTQGTGSHTYTHPTYGQLTADFAATTYNFSSMPNQLNWTPNTAISTLMLHCGIAIDMDYGPDASGASASAIRPALINHFNYEATAQTVYKSGYTSTVWESMLRNELDHSRPIFYFGTDTANGGHAFVCDGYQGTNYFHINWGWSGSDNGYFYLSDLNPGYFHFNSQQGATIGIQPTVAIAAPTNLTATLDPGDNVYLQWQSPITRSLLGFSIYKDGVLFGTVTNPLTTNYYDINLLPGTYQYYVVADFTQGSSEPSNTAVATIYPLSVINYQDSFENFADFTTSLSPWFSYDIDQSPTIELENVDFPLEGEPLSFMVFNPDATTPPLTEFAAVSGQKLLVCPGALNPPNNDWIVSPKWNTGSIGRFRFWAKSAYPDSGLEQIKVGINIFAPDPAGMTIISGESPISVPGIWTEYNYTLTNYLNSNAFVGIQCVSNSGGMLLLDKIQLWSTYVNNEDNASSAAPDLKLRVYPNPFYANASISCEQKEAAPVTVKIYDVKGQLVRTLTDGQTSSMSNNLVWNGTDNNGKSIGAGIYFCTVKDKAGHTSNQKIVRMK